MKKIVKLDVDDLLIDLNTPWVGLYNNVWNDNLKKEDILTWEMFTYVKPECGMRIYDYLNSELYDLCEPIEGALEGVEFLRKHYEVLFVTALHTNSIYGKFFRLKELGFKPTSEDFICCSNKNLVTGDYMVDDNLKTILNSNCNGVLYTQPWNKTSTYSPRCNNWTDVIRYFTKELNK